MTVKFKNEDYANYIEFISNTEILCSCFSG